MAQKKPKILLVDDDEDMCDSLSDVIKLETDYEVTSSTDPVKALVLIKKTCFSLIIIDYKMPYMNGLEMLKLIKESSPKSKVFILTAFISGELIHQAQKEGASRVLSKFIWPEEILLHIKEALQHFSLP